MDQCCCEKSEDKVRQLAAKRGSRYVQYVNINYSIIQAIIDKCSVLYITRDVQLNPQAINALGNKASNS